ncbi:MAG: hypothetical protein KAT05_02585 [Spirochaetes bacterium]|nr:hypothetical protein [Spirochaetota bacterium]
MSQESDLINKINKDKNSNIPLFDKDYLSSVHEKVINKVKRTVPQQQQQEQQQNVTSNKAEEVIQADMNFRKAVKELAISLGELNDKEIAQKLLGEHIIMLDSIFKNFE